MKVIVEGEGEWEFPDDATDGEIAVAINREQGLGPRGVPEFAGRPAGFEPKTRGPLLAALPAQAPRPVPGLEATGFGAEAAPQNPFMNQPVGPPAGGSPTGVSLPPGPLPPAGGAALPPPVNPLREAMLARRQAAGGAPLASLGPQELQATGAAAQPIPQTQGPGVLEGAPQALGAGLVDVARSAAAMPRVAARLGEGLADMVLGEAAGSLVRKLGEIAPQRIAGDFLEEKLMKPASDFYEGGEAARRDARDVPVGEKLKEPGWLLRQGLRQVPQLATSLGSAGATTAPKLARLAAPFVMEAGETARNLEEREAQTGKKLDNLAFGGAVVGKGAVAAGLELAGAEAILGRLAKYAPAGIRRKLGTTATKLLTGSVGEGGTERAQNLVGNFAEMMATEKPSMRDLFERAKTPEFWQALDEGGAESQVLGSLLGTAGSVGTAAGTMRRAGRIADARARSEAETTWRAEDPEGRRVVPPETIDAINEGVRALQNPETADEGLRRLKLETEALDARLQGLREPGATRAPEAAAFDPEGRRVVPQETIGAINEGVRELVPQEAPARPGLLDDVLARTERPNVLGDVLGATRARDRAAQAAEQRFRAEADSAERQRIAETPGAALRLILGDDPVFLQNDPQPVGVGGSARPEAAPGEGNPAGVPPPVRRRGGTEPGGTPGAPPAGPASLPPPVAPAAAAARSFALPEGWTSEQGNASFPLVRGKVAAITPEGHVGPYRDTLEESYRETAKMREEAAARREAAARHESVVRAVAAAGKATPEEIRSLGRGRDRLSRSAVRALADDFGLRGKEVQRLLNDGALGIYGDTKGDATLHSTAEVVERILYHLSKRPAPARAPGRKAPVVPGPSAAAASAEAPVPPVAPGAAERGTPGDVPNPAPSMDAFPHRGAMGSTWTADGERVDFQWALVDLAGDVVVSHRRSEPTLPLEENPDFPQGLQPRDRERVASAMQIDDIKRNLEPLRLEESAEASNGAPILGPDRVTESGNGRLIALEELYREGKAGPYTDRLKATAASRGLPVAEVERMRWPAAVRVRTSPTTDRAELVKKFNAPTVAGMAASETAEADGDRLSPDLLSRLHVGENGVDLLSAANGPFVRAFLAKLTPNEARTLVTADGVLSKDGRRRIEQALVGRAFGRSAVLEKITESADDNTRLVSSAILNSAPRMADVRAAIEQERLPRALDPTPAIEEAVQKLTWLRTEGQSVEGYLQQSGLFGDTMTPAGRAVLAAFGEFARSGKKTTAFLTQLGHGLMLEANEKLLSDLESPPLADFVGAARRFVSDGGQSTLFGGPDLSAPDPVQPDSGGDGERGPSGPVDGGRRSVRPLSAAPSVAEIRDQAARLAEPFTRGARRHTMLVERWVRAISDSWKDAPEIRVVSSERELPEGVRSRAEEFGATGTIEGLYTGPTEDVIYVVAPMVTSKADAERIVLHEVMGHAGLRRVLGRERFGETMRQIADSLPKDVEAKAREYGLDLEDADQRLEAAEEVLAEWASRPEAPPRAITRAMVAIRGWLRKLFPNLKWTPDDVRELLARARRRVEEGGGERATGEDARFARAIARAAEGLESVGPGMRRYLRYSAELAEAQARGDRENAKKLIRLVAVAGRFAAREWEAKLASDVGNARAASFTHSLEPTEQAILSRDTVEAGKWRITRVDDRGPSGHMVFDTKEEAIRHLAGTAPMALYRVGEMRPADIRFSRAQESTPEFRRWFGDSKVVDEAGRPKVVYHGTSGDFSEFSSGTSGRHSGNNGAFGKGFYFSFSPDVARNYADSAPVGEGRVIDAYLAIENPFRVPAGGRRTAQEIAGLKLPPDVAARLRDAKRGYEREGYPEDEADVIETVFGGGGRFSEVLRGNGFDGVFTEANEVVAFRPEQIKSATGNSGAFDPTNPDIRFSRRQEPKKTLVALHNTTEEGIRAMARLGGVPVPSLAITKPDFSFEGYGGITLVGDRALVDPKADRRNKVFEADAWSPRQPMPSREFRKKEFFRFGARVNDLLGQPKAWVERFDPSALDTPKNEGGYERLIETLARPGYQSFHVQRAFLLAQGIDVPFVMREENGRREINFGETEAALKEAMRGRESAFRAWLEEELAPVFGPEHLARGRRKLPYTIDNLVAAMTAKGLRAKENTVFESLAKQRAASARTIPSVEGMHRLEDRIVGKWDMTQAKEALNEEFFSFVEGLGQNRFFTGQFAKLDEASAAIGSVLKSGRTSRDGLAVALTSRGFPRPSDEVLDAGLEVARGLSSAPTEYFEAKPQRAVKLAEFKGAVVPEGTPQDVKDILAGAGLDVRTYRDEQGERGRVVSEMTEERGLRFSRTPSAAEERIHGAHERWAEHAERELEKRRAWHATAQEPAPFRGEPEKLPEALSVGQVVRYIEIAWPGAFRSSSEARRQVQEAARRGLLDAAGRGSFSVQYDAGRRISADTGNMSSRPIDYATWTRGSVDRWLSSRGGEEPAALFSRATKAGAPSPAEERVYQRLKENARRKAQEAREAAQRVLDEVADPGDILEARRDETLPPHSRLVQDKLVPAGRKEDVDPLLKPVEALYQKAVRRHYAVEKTSERVGADKGPAHLDPGVVAELSAGHAARAEQFIEGKGGFRLTAHGGIEWTGNRSLAEILKPLGKGRLNELRRYLVARRVIELHARKASTGEGDMFPDVAEDRSILCGISEAAARSEVAGAPEDVKQAAEEITALLDDALQYWAEAGGLSPEAVRIIREMNRAYVPFYRIFEGHDPAAKAGKLVLPAERGKALQAEQAVKRLVGSSRDILDPLVSTVDHIQRMIRAADLNRVGKTLVEAAAKNPDGAVGLVERVPTTGEAKATKEGDAIQKVAAAYDVDVTNEAAEAIDALSDRKLWFDNDRIRVWRNGKLEEYRVERSLAESLRALGPQDADVFQKLFTFPSKLLRGGVTKTPIFALHNFLRDTGDAAVQSRNGFRPFVDSAIGLAEAIRNGDLRKEWLAAGGGYATLAAGGVKGAESALRSIAPRTKAGTVIKTLRHPLEALSLLNRPFEEAARLGEYRRAKKAGKSATEAALDAARITTNFTVHGSSAFLWGILKASAFSNPALQGTDKAFRTVLEAPRGQKQTPRLAAKAAANVVFKGMLYVGGLSVLFGLLGDDDDEIKELRRTKAGAAWWFARVPGTETIVRIPKPFLWGQLFGTGVEAMLDRARDENPIAFKEWRTQVLEMITDGAVPIPTPMKVGFELATNRSLFYKRPIVPRGLENVEGRYQYGPRTSETAKAAGRLTGLSPAKLEYGVGQIGGTLGREALRTSDAIARAGGDVEKPAARLGDLPLVGRAFASTPTTSSDSIETFYDELKDVRSAVETARHLKKTDPEEWERRRPELRRKILLSRRYESVADQIGDIRKRIYKLEKRADLSAEEKRTRIDGLIRRQTEIARRHVDRRLLEERER